MHSFYTHDISRARILVIDQDPLVAKLLSRILSKRHYQVMAAPADLSQVASMLERQKPYLVMLDAELKNAGAFKVLAHLKTLSTPVGCLVTANHFDFLAMSKMLEQGADGYLGKPFDALAMRTEVERITNKYMIQRVARSIAAFQPPKTPEVLRSFHDTADGAGLKAHEDLSSCCAA